MVDMKDDFDYVGNTSQMTLNINRGEHKSLMLAEKIIAEAKSRFPVSVCVKGLLTEEEREKIEAECRITVPSVYMDGSCTYYIRWDGYRNKEGSQ